MSDFVSTHPATRIDPKWFSTFALQLQQTQTIAGCAGSCDLLLLGDSITEACAWMGEFQNPLRGLKICYYGIGGDQTQHVLWRIQNGLLDGIKPKFATLLIGINNFWPDTSAEEVAAGAIACGQAMRAKLADTRLLHFGVFPVGSHILNLNGKVDQINDRIAADTAGYGAEFHSLRNAFLAADGREIPGMLAADGVHITAKAYDVWGSRIKELIA